MVKLLVIITISLKKTKKIQLSQNQLKFTVKLFGATIFEVESFGEEKYIKDKLISFNSKTRQNKKDKYVQLKLSENENAYDIKGSSYTGSASLENIIEIGGVIKFFKQTAR